MLTALRTRYLDLLGSIYLYNEHRGYTSIDRVLGAVCAREPGNTALIAAIEKHRADERKHYQMFKRWFALRGRMPFRVDRTCGHIDRFVEIVFGRTIDALDTQAIIASDAAFEKLARVIALTERRGHRQVHILLAHPSVRRDKALMRIFTIIERDEPSHWSPYEGWLAAHARRTTTRRDRMIDRFIHSELLFVKLPALFLNPWLARRSDWPNAGDAGARPAQPLPIAA